MIHNRPWCEYYNTFAKLSICKSHEIERLAR
jgi:hypothetical protein